MASFLTFLESGELPLVTAAAEPKTPAARAVLRPCNRGLSLAAVTEEWVKPPPGPPLAGFSALQPSGSRHVVSVDQRPSTAAARAPKGSKLEGAAARYNNPASRICPLHAPQMPWPPIRFTRMWRGA